ncbi:hypothetical protein GN244_ATG06282 [Phytophthora infestans]|uniref:Uncharacterized protein n=1 Tax=Phytophthora infestans TaxID=4787 RepID=A0A833S644_PHYIN|nr:hypothetical protein GN244_ATG06282 [Phytophthora infestans]
MPPKAAAQTPAKKQRVQAPAKKQWLQPPTNKQRLHPPTVLSSGEDESDDDLESDCSVGVGSQEAFKSDEDEPTTEKKMWVHDAEAKYEIWQIDDVRYDIKGEISEEPAALLMESHGEEGKLAERFKKSDVKQFQQFCQTDEFCKHIGARVIGRSSIIPEDVVDKFLDDELKEGRDLLQGCTWKQFAKLLPRLRAARCDLVINCFQKNLAPGGHRGPTFIKNLVVEDGCCLVGAYNRNFYGHCVVLCVADGGQKRSIFDEDTDGNIVEKSIDEQNWIVFYAFVRPFRVFNRRG